MSLLVVDASVLVKWFIPEIHSIEACRLLEGSDDFIAPDLLFAEAANVVVNKVRRGELSEADTRQLINDIAMADVDTVPCRELAGDAHALAVTTGCSAYDAMYVALAVRNDTLLITADQKLANRMAAVPMLKPHVQFLLP